jgi:UDP-GlcNAc3NAcA epimerase
MINLGKEGFDLQRSAPYSADAPGVFHCGDIMLDNSLYYAHQVGSKATYLQQLGLEKNKFILVTVHRDHNTDVAERLSNIVRALVDIAQQSGQTVVLPLHPRTRKKLTELDGGKWDTILRESSAIQIIEPASFLEMIALESNCSFIVTDSGGVQKEAFFFQKPCVILRPQTEWVEIVNNGNAKLADADYNRIMSGYQELSQKSDFTWPALFGDGKAAEFICQQIDNYIP